MLSVQLWLTSLCVKMVPDSHFLMTSDISWYLNLKIHLKVVPLMYVYKPPQWVAKHKQPRLHSSSKCTGWHVFLWDGNVLQESGEIKKCSKSEFKCFNWYTHQWKWRWWQHSSIQWWNVSVNINWEYLQILGYTFWFPIHEIVKTKELGWSHDVLRWSTIM